MSTTTIGRCLPRSTRASSTGSRALPRNPEAGSSTALVRVAGSSSCRSASAWSMGSGIVRAARPQLGQRRRQLGLPVGGGGGIGQLTEALVERLVLLAEGVGQGAEVSSSCSPVSEGWAAGEPPGPLAGRSHRCRDGRSRTGPSPTPAVEAAVFWASASLLAAVMRASRAAMWSRMAAAVAARVAESEAGRMRLTISASRTSTCRRAVRAADARSSALALAASVSAVSDRALPVTTWIS